MLRALAFRRACERAPLWIAENELIISHPAGGPRGGEVSPELSWRWVAEELDTVKERKQDPYQISDSAKRILREEIFPFGAVARWMKSRKLNSVMQASGNGAMNTASAT